MACSPIFNEFAGLLDRYRTEQVSRRMSGGLLRFVVFVDGCAGQRPYIAIAGVHSFVQTGDSFLPAVGVDPDEPLRFAPEAIEPFDRSRQARPKLRKPSFKKSNLRQNFVS